MNDELRTLVLQRAPAEAVAQAAIVSGMQTLQQGRLRESPGGRDDVRRAETDPRLAGAVAWSGAPRHARVVRTAPNHRPEAPRGGFDGGSLN